jgi:glycosyltransferase involved in cell wall biosynthesis
MPLQWHLPPSPSWEFEREPQARAVLFPGPTASRKCAHELRAAALELDLEIVLWGSELEGEDFWRGVKTRREASFDQALNDVYAVVQPALVEDNPRLLLRALSCGVPVVATPYCGLGERDGVLNAAPGDAFSLGETLARVINGAKAEPCSL